jgi:prepilin signal peptidase PulO-like enzyme (type II secretory pathway)
MHWAAALIAAAAGVPAGYAASVLIVRLPGGPAAGQRGVRRLVPGTLTVAGCAAMGLRFGLSPVLPAYCYLAVLSVTLGFIDARHRRLPDVLTLSGYPAGAVLLGAAAAAVPGGPRLLVHAVLGAALAGALYLVLACLYPQGIGWGDIKLSGVLGMFLGWLGARAFVTGLVSPFALAAVSGAAMIAAGAATRKSRIPFGPYMAGAAVAVILASPFLPA